MIVTFLLFCVRTRSYVGGLVLTDHSTETFRAAENKIEKKKRRNVNFKYFAYNKKKIPERFLHRVFMGFKVMI